LTEAPLTWPILLRRGWLFVLAVAAGVAVAWAVSGIAVSATSAFAVKAVGVDQTPYQSGRLALTYAQLLPEDPEVVGAIATAIDASHAEVRDHLTMSAQPETNVVFARYSAPSGDVAKRALVALARALHKRGDAAGSNLSATVTVLSEPTLDNGFSRKKGLLLGAVGGFLVALATVIAWERRTPRVDDLRGLAQILPLPLFQIGRGAVPRTLDAIESADGGPLEPVVVPAVPRGANALLAAATRSERREPTAAGPGSRALLIERGAQAADVEASWRASAATGPAIVGAVLVTPESALRRRRRRRR
jgi:hypothetical protein